MERGGADLNGMRKCLDLLAQGEALVLFPEGGRYSGPELHKLADGAAYLSLRSRLPIIPVAIWGAEAAMGRGSKFPRPRRMHMIVGEPMYPAQLESPARVPRDLMNGMTANLQENLQNLFTEARLKATRSQ